MSDKISSGQTPSKVLHIRNLPYETSQEELEDLSKQFGRLVKSKLNVGPNRNQAFIEFPDVNSAVNMVHHFMSSAEPAKVRSCPCATPTVRARGPFCLPAVFACTFRLSGVVGHLLCAVPTVRSCPLATSQVRAVARISVLAFVSAVSGVAWGQAVPTGAVRLPSVAVCLPARLDCH